MALSTNYTQHSVSFCRVLIFIVMLNSIMLNVIVLGVVMLSVVAYNRFQILENETLLE
jgi:hypothetical protein